MRNRKNRRFVYLGRFPKLEARLRIIDKEKLRFGHVSQPYTSEIPSSAIREGLYIFRCKREKGVPVRKFVYVHSMIEDTLGSPSKSYRAYKLRILFSEHPKDTNDLFHLAWAHILDFVIPKSLHSMLPSIPAIFLTKKMRDAQSALYLKNNGHLFE